MKKVIHNGVRHERPTYFYVSHLILTVLVLFAGLVSADIIIDNRDSATASVGSWPVSGGPNPYGIDSVYARNPNLSFSWLFTPTESGYYKVSMWWTEFSSRSTVAPVEVQHAAGTAFKTVDQQTGGLTWNDLGQYNFNAGTTYRVTIRTLTDNSSISADAVQFVKLPPPPIVADFEANPVGGDMPLTVSFTDLSILNSGTMDTWGWDFDNDGTIDSTVQNPVHTYASAGLYSVRLTVSGSGGSGTLLKQDLVSVTDPSVPYEVIIDNRDLQTASIGTWPVSGALDPYGVDSVYARNPNLSFSWLFTPAKTGTYQVSMWWTEFSSRSTAAPVEIQHDGIAISKTVDQQTDGGKWNPLGEYSFTAGNTYPVTIRTRTDNSSISADAVRFVKIPPSTIVADFGVDTLMGNLPLTVNFTDLSTSVGTITGWQWDFDNNGTIDSTVRNPSHVYLNAGLYSVRLIVSGSEGSDTVTKEDFIEVTDPAAPYEVVIDNGDPGTSSTGVWTVSGGVPPWGTNSLWARNVASYSWRFTPEKSGVFNISMWWTEFSSRGTALPVSIQNYFGTAQTTLDQQTNGGKWNLLGAYYLQAGLPYTVTLNASGGSPTACADAVRFVRVPVENLPPYATIDEISPNPSKLGQQVLLRGSGTDVDGTIAAYQWSSDRDGIVGNTAQVTTSTLTGGVHNLSLKVQDDDGAWSVVATKKAIVLNSAEIEHVYACFSYGSERVNYQWEDMLVTIGAYKVDDLWVYTNPAQNKSYVIHTVTSIEGMQQAMKEQDSHILFYGHSNYGVGPIFPTSAEQSKQVIEELYYVDDDRILNYSTDTVAVSISGMLNSQAYPNWYPVFKNGSSAVAPYDFGDPRGNPPHNYYVTYQVPGDPTYYKVETSRTPALTRFPDSGHPAWYSATGSLPNPANSSHRQYFITNSSPWSSPFNTTDGWAGSIKVAGFYGGNYLWTDAGTGDKQATWSFYVPFTGQYQVSARWAASSGRTAAAPYRVTHALGSTTVPMNQKVNGGTWNSLGTFTFNSDQDWYESRNDDPTLLTLNTANVGGNSSKKAAFRASLSDNAYLTQKFKIPRHGTVRAEWDIYMDTILNDSSRDRGGMMLVGSDTGSGPNRGTGPFVYMAFWCVDGGGTPGDGKTMTLIAREPGDSFDVSTQWRPLATNLEFDRWYKVAVECDTVNGTYDVYVDNVLMQSGVSATNNIYDLTHISFAQWNDGAGAFYVDNVYGDTAQMLLDNQFDGSADSAALRALDVTEYPVTLTNNTATGNVIADAIRIADAANPPSVLVADFYAATRTGTAPFDVAFSNQSTGDTETKTWNFGDGTATVQTTNNSVSHTYPANGVYTVTLTVRGEGGSSSITKANYITVGGTTPQQVEFSASSREGTLPRNVSFRNRSSGSISSVLWNFGDGTTSTSSNPTHAYIQPGNYDVTLTVTFTGGTVKTLTKNAFVRAIVFEQIIDNINYPPYHYGSKTILMRGPLEIDPAEMKYKRMFMLSCNSGSYYLQTLGRGVVFYSLDDTEVNPGTGFSIYLRAYMLGQSDQQILNGLLAKQAAFDYYDFTKRPDQQN